MKKEKDFKKDWGWYDYFKWGILKASTFIAIFLFVTFTFCTIYSYILKRYGNIPTFIGLSLISLIMSIVIIYAWYIETKGKGIINMTRDK